MERDVLTATIIKQFECIVSLYNTIEKTTYSYGTDTLLHPSEIHTIAAIGDHPSSNLTELSGHLNVTKGATTKMVQRLVKKGLVIKQFAPYSENEIMLSLTTTGQKAYEGHRTYRKDLMHELSAIYTDTPEQVLLQLLGIGSETERVLHHMMSERIDASNEQ
ncbi:MAG: MarR family winged helix-turn-helix transcriptional regulator [Sporolactobacillus sp.]